jgi:tRNA-dihydrouridine synthase 3
MSEMAIARNLFRGYHKNVRKERALCRKSELDESTFGFQIATKCSSEGIRAAQFAQENGASWIDLNCGCPIWEATSKGLGCAMLKRPERLYKMVDMFTKESPLPVTVKIRLGVTEGTGINVKDVVQGLKNAGAQAVTIHGRTGEARYSKPANWPLITEMAKEHSPDLPIIGNGDLLTHWECKERLEKNDVDAIMAARGALIKPWLFKEYRDDLAWDPSPEQRVAEVYFRLAQSFKDQFGDDSYAKKHTMYFLPWHFNFFCRYRPISRETHDHCYDIGAPPIQNSRALDDYLRAVDPLFDADPLENLLRNDNPAVHKEFAEILWRSQSADDAVRDFKALAGEPTRVSMLITDAEATAAIGNDESSWESGKSGPHDEVSTSKKVQIHANNHRVFNSVDRSLFDLEIRVGKVVAVRPHENADNLQVNEVDFGPTHGRKVIVTGRKGEESNFLLDLSVLCLTNIRPATLRGQLSEAMVLFSESNDHNFMPLLAPDSALPGTAIGFQEEGFEENPSSDMNVFLSKESHKGKYASTYERVRKSLKRVLSHCYTRNGKVVYRTSGERKDWVLVANQVEVRCGHDGTCC